MICVKNRYQNIGGAAASLTPPPTTSLEHCKCVWCNTSPNRHPHFPLKLLVFALEKVGAKSQQHQNTGLHPLFSRVHDSFIQENCLLAVLSSKRPAKSSSYICSARGFLELAVSHFEGIDSTVKWLTLCALSAVCGTGYFVFTDHKVLRRLFKCLYFCLLLLQQSKDAFWLG